MPAKMMDRTNPSASWKMVNWTRIARNTSDYMVMEGTIEIGGTKNGMTMTGIEARVAEVCPEVLRVRHKECGVECSKMEEGVVVPIRTIGGVAEIGLVIISVTDTMVTIDTRNQTIIAITGIGIEVIGPTRINEIDTRQLQEVTQTIITVCHQAVTILQEIIRTDMLPGTIEEEVHLVVEAAQGEILWTIEAGVVAAAAEEEDEGITTEGHLLQLVRRLPHSKLKPQCRS